MPPTLSLDYHSTSKLPSDLASTVVHLIYLVPTAVAYLQPLLALPNTCYY